MLVKERQMGVVSFKSKTRATMPDLLQSVQPRVF